MPTENPGDAGEATQPPPPKRAKKAAAPKSEVAPTEVDGYKSSQHPFVRKFVASLESGTPNWLFYLGAVQVYRGEANLPTKPMDLLHDWLYLDGKYKSYEAMIASNIEQDHWEYKIRREVLNKFRQAASVLGISDQDHPAVKKPIAELRLVQPEKKKVGHAPGHRKGLKYDKYDKATKPSAPDFFGPSQKKPEMKLKQGAMAESAAIVKSEPEDEWQGLIDPQLVNQAVPSVEPGEASAEQGKAAQNAESLVNFNAESFDKESEI
jgi:hypothetical protein